MKKIFEQISEGTFQADLMDKASLIRALEGSNVVLYAAGSQNLLGVSNTNDSAKRVL